MLKDRLHAARKQAGLTLDEVAKKVGVSRQTIHRYETGIINNVPSDKIEKIALVLNTTPAELMGWGEPQTHGKPMPVTIDLDTERTVHRSKKAPYIPILGTIAAGIPIEAQEDIQGYIAPEAGTRATFALRVKGDSMVNVPILDGDLVLIHQQSDVDDGEIAAVLVDNSATIKRFYRHSNGVELRPANDTMKAMFYTGIDCENIRILGKVTGCLHRYEVHDL